MAVGKELFKLFGMIGMQGVEKVEKDLKKVDKQVRKAQKEIDRLGRRVSDTGKVLTKVFTLPLLAAAAASVKFIDDATDLNETISKTGEIFGESAKEVEKWAETAAVRIGQSKTQAMDAASTFAIFGKSAGLAGKDLTKFSTEFVELASDMASFFNTEPDEAITAIGAAFRGEMEPIRKYGVLLDDMTMRQKAFELGLISSTKNALMPQTKVLAAQALIIDQTKVAQGDFARTSAGLANQKRILSAQLKNISATLGQLFLPAALEAGKIVQRLIGYAERLIEAWKQLDPQTRRTIKGFILIAGALGPTVFLIGKVIALSKILIPLLVALKTGTFSLSAAMATLSKSVLGVTLVIGALVALGWYWYSQWDTLSVQIKAIWAKVDLFFSKIVIDMGVAFNDMVLSILEGIEKVASAIPGLTVNFKQAKIDILKSNAVMLKDLADKQRYTNTINTQAEAMQDLSTTIKKAIADGKKAIGIKEEDTKKTQKQIDAEKEAARQAEKTAKERVKFNQRILDETRKLGADKFELLAIEREKAIEEAEKLGADVLAVKKLYDAKEKELLAEDEKARQEFNQRTKDELNQLTLDKLALLDLEKQEALQKAEELGVDTLNVKRLYLLKEQQLKDQLRKEESEKDKRELQKRLRMTSNIGNKLDGILSKFSDNKMKRLEFASQKEIDAIKHSQLTDEQKELAIQKIEEDTEKKRQKLERQRAIREKAAALFNIAINTASAIVEALPNIPLSILVGALGVAEGVAVATAPLPFQEGALIKGSERGVAGLVGEENQDELIFPLEQGIGLFIDGLMERLAEIEIPAFGTPALAGAGGPARTVNLNIGTFIGDERGLKELERRLDTIRIAENQRKGF